MITNAESSQGLSGTKSVDINVYDNETTCVFKNERYSVRDNGAVMRHARKGKRLRKYDNQWTFGNPISNTGYLGIASARLHRIVATAFHGEPPSEDHVLVDHKDTNRRNNRPENLKWVTRLENAVGNPITIRRIELACGCSIEEFIADPAKYRHKLRGSNDEWMCTVSPEEARLSYERMLNWAKSYHKPSGGSLGNWIFEPKNMVGGSEWGNQLRESMLRDNPPARNYSQNRDKEVQPEPLSIVQAITPNAVQKKWKTPSEFPLCPNDPSDKPIVTYASNLKVGSIFSSNHHTTSIILDFAVSNGEDAILVMCKSNSEDAIKPWNLAQITYEKGYFVHTSLGNFFKEESAVKYFTLAQGLEWTRSAGGGSAILNS